MKKIKRIAAMIMVIFLLGLYVWSFVAALLARPEANRMFMAAIITTIFLPILLYVFLWVAELLRGKGVENPEEEKNNKIKGGN